MKSKRGVNARPACIAALLILVAAAGSAQTPRLARVAPDGRTGKNLPECETFRDFNHVPARSRARVQQFWRDVARPFFAAKQNDMAAYEAAVSALPKTLSGRDSSAQFRLQHERLLEDYRAVQQRRGDEWINQRRRFILSLPPGDRWGAERAMAVLAPPPNTCR